MAALPIPERAVVRRTRNPPPPAEQELFLAIRALQTPKGRWLLEVVKLFLDKLPPAQLPLPSILPQFNPGPPLQSLLSSPVSPGVIPRCTITPVEERYSRTSSTHELSVHAPAAPRPTPTFRPIYERYERRLADLKNLLGPLTCGNDSSGDDHKHEDSGCVLLCWGSSSSCRVLAVNHIGRTIDQELFWKKLQTAWYDTRGRWRQKMPWYGIRSVKRVEICLVGPDPKTKDLFYGVYQPADKALETEKQKLRESISTFSGYPKPDSFDELEFGPCWYDYERGFTVHSPEVCSLLDYPVDSDLGFPDPTCPVEELQKNKERLKRLEMEPLRTLLFQNPKMAVYNELENAELVYSSK